MQLGLSRCRHLLRAHIREAAGECQQAVVQSASCAVEVGAMC